MLDDWNEVQKVISPIKNYKELCQRWQESFAYPFVRERFNFRMPELVEYTRLGVGGNPRGRYTDYASKLVRIFTELHEAGIGNLLDLKDRVDSREKLEAFAAQNGMLARDVASALKFLIYWFIPMKKFLSGLVRDDPYTSEAIRKLRELGIRTNLDMLQEGIRAAGRKSLAGRSGLPEEVISELVNRADLSRMPWASKATISNIVGAGYGSLDKLANADPEQLYEHFFHYGKSIGKNLKLGNEIENSHRIAKIVPVVLE